MLLTLGAAPARASDADVRYIQERAGKRGSDAGEARKASPWEAGVSKKLIDADLARDPGDRHALRVGGIRDSFHSDYPEALRKLDKAMAAGVRDPTTLAFASLAGFHHGRMKDAAAWSKASLEAAPDGPWAKMADAVLHLTKENLSRVSDPQKPKRFGLPPVSRKAEEPQGAVGPALFPQPDAAKEGAGGGSAEILRAARRAWTVRDYSGADALARKVLAERPGDPEALTLAAAAALRRGRYQQAIADALALPLSGAGSAAGARLLAYSQAGLGDRASMLKTLERGARGDPATAELLHRARALPEGADLTALFTDAPLLDDETLPSAPEQAPAVPVKVAGSGRVFLLGLLALLGPLAGLWAFRRLRGGGADLPRRTSLDVELLKRRSGLTPAARPVSMPTRVGPYRVLGPVGHGGMGVIYKAKDTARDRLVALKKMRSEIAADPRERERFLKEARLAAALEHPGIVRLHEVYEAAAGAYLVFEYVDGKTLAQYLLERERLPYRKARRVILSAAAAVAYAHEHGVVHRDLKTTNIIVDVKGAVRVMDFGVARASKDAITRLTQGAPVAAQGHLAPEQEDGGASTALSDVYALGGCLYELLAGRPPYAGTGLELYQAKRAGPPPPLGELLEAEDPAGVDALLAKALAAGPSARFASAGDFAAALKAHSSRKMMT